ncbi:hypothetical protein GQ54DRAFT_110954 [Martensiomyces pterosporus]|nr:hypothetical protein GQ54DRAFT_110954 [Martensiomyces pterosporus]
MGSAVRFSSSQTLFCSVPANAAVMRSHCCSTQISPSWFVFATAPGGSKRANWHSHSACPLRCALVLPLSAWDAYQQTARRASPRCIRPLFSFVCYPHVHYLDAQCSLKNENPVCGQRECAAFS